MFKDLLLLLETRLGFIALSCGKLDSRWRNTGRAGAIKGLNDHRAVKIPALHFPAIMAVIMASVPICLCQSGIWFQEILLPVGAGPCYLSIYFLAKIWVMLFWGGACSKDIFRFFFLFCFCDSDLYIYYTKIQWSHFIFPGTWWLFYGFPVEPSNPSLNLVLCFCSNGF